MIKIYINLTLGLAVYGYIQNPSLIRVQSSHIESKAYNKLFYGLSDDLLYHLAKGYTCLIIDGSSNHCSKVIRIGIPVIKYVLNRRWFNEEIKQRGFDINWLRKVYKELKSDTKAKLKYYRKYLGDNRGINLNGISIKTEDK